MSQPCKLIVEAHAAVANGESLSRIVKAPHPTVLKGGLAGCDVADRWMSKGTFLHHSTYDTSVLRPMPYTRWDLW